MLERSPRQSRRVDISCRISPVLFRPVLSSLPADSLLLVIVLSLGGMKYMLDTNIFNAVLDGHLPIHMLPSGGTFVATHVQEDELAATSDVSRKSQLLSQFEALLPKREATFSFCLDISRLDRARLSDGEMFRRLKSALDTANDGKRNNIQDALIGETSIANGFTLVTCDKDLSEAVGQQGGLVVYFEYGARRKRP
jgi:predicted nucleic acid-binding protein